MKAFVQKSELTDRYDVDAKTETDTDMDQLRLMVQILLADRFKLTVHRESKPDQNVYDLIVGKNGPKLQSITVDTYASNAICWSRNITHWWRKVLPSVSQATLTSIPRSSASSAKPMATFRSCGVLAIQF
jgi:uncharacterized protein (TIGR03435 family)